VPTGAPLRREVEVGSHLWHSRSLLGGPLSKQRPGHVRHSIATAEEGEVWHTGH
jgi:hypothetical protein